MSKKIGFMDLATGKDRTVFHGKVFLDFGGEMFTISVGGKRYRFEMHPYCGPNILNRKDEPRRHQPADFLEAASLWVQQGKKVEDGLCVWYREPKAITKHLGGRHYEVIGYEPAERGS